MRRALLAIAALSLWATQAAAQNGHPISGYPAAPTPYTGTECSIGTGTTGATVNICTAPIAVLANSPSVRAALPAASTLTGAEILSATQSGQTVRLTASAIAGLAAVTVPGGSSGQLQYDNAGAFGGFTLAGDCTLAQPTITCTKTGGVAFGALATLSAINNGNWSGTVLSAANGGTGVGNTGNLTWTGALTFTDTTGQSFALPASSTTLAGLGTAQTWTAVQTVTNSDLKLLGSSTGATTFTSANAGASNFVITVPAATDTLVDLAGSQTLTNKSIAASQITSAAWSVGQGGTGGTSASGTLLDNIAGFASTGFLTRTGAGTYAFQSATNGVTLGNIAQIGANTVLGNGTGSTANASAQAMPSCSGASSALSWTTSTGFGCNTIASGFTPTAAEFTYSVASGSSSDVAAFTTSTWTQRKLNTTVSNTISGLSLTTNQLTIPAGTFLITYGANWYSSGGTGNNLVQSRFRDTTASASFCVSGFMASPATSYGEGPSGGSCILTVGSSHVFEIDTWVNIASTTTSGGFPASSGENETYVRIAIVQIH
jgi:hypothetical protein